MWLVNLGFAEDEAIGYNYFIKLNIYSSNSFCSK